MEVGKERVFSTTIPDWLGQIPHGSADLLQLDCAGAEWDIFENHAVWNHFAIRNNHLWAKPGTTTATLRHALLSLGLS